MLFLASPGAVASEEAIVEAVSELGRTHVFLAEAREVSSSAIELRKPILSKYVQVPLIDAKGGTKGGNALLSSKVGNAPLLEDAKVRTKGWDTLLSSKVRNAPLLEDILVGKLQVGNTLPLKGLLLEHHLVCRAQIGQAFVLHEAGATHIGPI